MRYLGGKSRIAKHLVAEIERVRMPGQLVWDAFCGGLSMSVALRKNGPVWSTDANFPLITLYKSIINGWDPPEHVTEKQYNEAKTLPDSDPLKAYSGFCAGFGGKYFGGYARGENRNWAAEGKRALLRDCPKLWRVDCVDFLSIKPRPTRAILYLDPPYIGTTGYAGVASFDHSKFVSRVAEWAKHTHVFVSEYSFEIGNLVWSKSLLKRATVGPGDMATERLYHLHPG